MLLLLKNIQMYLPTWIGISIVQKMLFDPTVYKTQRDFISFSFHGHANQCRVREWWFFVTVLFVLFDTLQA